MLLRVFSRIPFQRATWFASQSRLVLLPNKPLVESSVRFFLTKQSWSASVGLLKQGDSSQTELTLPGSVYLQKRYKKKGGKKGQRKASAREEEEVEEEDDDDSDDDDDDDDLGEAGDLDSRLATTTVISLRLDALGKTCFGMSRAKFDEHFYAGLIRVNGERVSKKSYEVSENDEIDMIRGFNLELRDQLDVNRVNLLKIDDKASSSGRLKITYRKTNKLTIDNYPRDPYDGSLISSGN